MSDVLLPLHLRQARTSIRYVDSVGVSRGLYTGAVRTAVRGGDRLAASLQFTSHGGATTDERSSRAVLRSFLARLRGRQNRAYLIDTSYQRRGAMPTAELVSNNTFANGTTGFTADAAAALTSSDRVLRSTRTASGTSNCVMTPATTVVAFAPYVVRMMLLQGRAATGTQFSIGAGSTASGFEYGSLPNPSTDYGMYTYMFVPRSTTAYGALQASPAMGPIAGDYFSVPYTSVSRGAAVDNGANLLLNSDDFTGSGWSKSALNVSANSIAAPDGTTTADSLIESSATASHFISQTASVAAAVEDISFGVALQLGNRQFVRIRLIESFGSTAASVYFDLANGLVGSIANGSNWLNTRAFIRPMGSGWYACHVVARKNTGAATSVNAVIGLATADGTDSYTGTGSNLNYAWRATLAQSSLPVRLSQTTAAATGGTSQSGSALHSKGWPASSSGLLLADDQFEVITSRGSELKILTAPVNSDAAGLAYMQFEPPLRGAPSDNSPIIVHQPMGRFIYTGESVGWDNDPGFFTSASCDFEEAIL